MEVTNASSMTKLRQIRVRW